MLHRADDLRYRLLRGAVALEPLRVVACRTVTFEVWTIRFLILGASHAVTLTQDDVQIAELLTCIPAPTGRSATDDEDLPFVRDIPLNGSRATHAFPLWAPSGTGEVLLNRFPLGDDALIGAFDDANQLTADFPPVVGAIPRTRLGWRFSAGRLDIESVHTYPEEGHGVRSRSSFQLKVEAQG